MRKEAPPEGPTADEFEQLMVEQRRRLVAWTHLEPKPDEAADEANATRPAE